MIPGFATVLAASANDRRDLFIGAGNRLGTVQQNIEKVFWVCWTLYSTVCKQAAQDCYFMGGTSLSKAYGLISRFSEDIGDTLPSSEMTSVRPRRSTSWKHLRGSV
jgi:predicted nucleotidyltransferase component of viral defense system